MASGGPYLLLVNPSAGGGRVRRLLPRAEAALRAREIDFRIVETESAEHGREEALAAAAEGITPVVMSGDGLIGQVGGALAGTGAPLGIIPGGRGNDLARVLGIPSDPGGASDVLAAGASRAIDVGEINGRRFLGVASFGFDSDANRIANEAKWVRGNLVYLYAALRALAAWRPARFSVRLDGEERDFTGYSVAVANSGMFGGGMRVAPRAEIDDGLLDVVYITDHPKLRYLRGLPSVFSGKHVENEEVVVLRGSEIELGADRPFAVYADGDHLTDLPATVRVLPQALEVIAPPPASR
jgi:YegS/Rv2252/BmrU family lipid kinase